MNPKNVKKLINDIFDKIENEGMNEKEQQEFLKTIIKKARK